jgi:hypothetical protein
VVAALAAGCASVSVTTTTTTSATPSRGQIHLASVGTPTECHARLSGHDATITFNSATLNVEPMCAQFVQKSAALGELWVADGPATAYGTPQTVCNLVSGSVNAAVIDTGTLTYGQSACTGMITAGWTEQAPTQ